MSLWLYTAWVALRLVAWWVAFAGVGSLVLRALGCRERGEAPLRLQPWLGLAATLAGLQLWHFVFPIDRRAVLFILGLSAAGWWVAPRAPLSSVRPRNWIAAVLASSALALWIAVHTTTSARVYDSGLYHLSSVRWAATYPVVPGLGHLHGRLAFNHSYFLYAALLHAAHPDGRYHHLASGVLLFGAFLHALAASVRVFVSKRSAPRLCDVFEIVLLVPLIVFTIGESSSSPTPDLAVSLLGMRLGSELWRVLESRGQKGQDTGGPAWHSAAIIILAGAAFTVKLSAAALALLCGLMASGPLLSRQGKLDPCRRRAVGWAIGVLVLLLGAWVGRGIVLSGYPFYPSAWGGVPVEWRMPRHAVERERDWIRSWARIPGPEPREVLGRPGWFRPWLRRMAQHRFHVIVPVAITAALAPLLAWLRVRNDAREFSIARRWFLAPAGAILVWFFTAPEPRLSGSLFWILASGALAFALQGSDRLMVASVLAATLLPLLARSVDAREFLYPWQRDTRPLPAALVELKTTHSGLGVYVPMRGDQCWDAPLPCSPYFDPRLRLRRAGDLASGFVLAHGPQDGS